MICPVSLSLPMTCKEGANLTNELTIVRQQTSSTQYDAGTANVNKVTQHRSGLSADQKLFVTRKLFNNLIGGNTIEISSITVSNQHLSHHSHASIIMLCTIDFTQEVH